jgi:hypothetical protein
MCTLHKSLLICVGLTLIGWNLCWTPAFAGIPEPGIVLYGQVRHSTGALVTSGELVLTYSGSGGGDPITVSVQLTRIEAPGGPFCYKALIPLETAIPGYPVSASSILLSATPVEYTRTAIVPEKSISITDTVSISTADRGAVRLLSLGATSLDDADQDGLPDTWEKQIVDANPNDAIASVNDVRPEDDFDGDGESNSLEYLNGTDPTDPMSARLGDIDGDGYISLNDTILVLKLISGIEPTPNVSGHGDVNGDGRIGLEEAFYIIQKLSGVR